MLSPCLSRRHPAVPQYSVITYTDVGIRAMSNMMHHASCPTILCSLAATHTTPGAYATKPPCEAQAKASLNPVSVRGQLPAFTRAPRATQCMRSATRSLPTPHITPAVRWPSDQAARTPRICDARPHLPWDLQPLGLQMARGAYQNPGADRRACGAPWLLNLLVLPRFSGVAWLGAVRDVDVRCAGPIAKLHLNERSVVGGSATRADVRGSRMGWGACS